jgi:hypothetical protein
MTRLRLTFIQQRTLPEYVSAALSDLVGLLEIPPLQRSPRHTVNLPVDTDLEEAVGRGAQYRVPRGLSFAWVTNR